MSQDKNALKPAIKVKLAGMDDLVRMAFFSASRNHTMNILCFQDKDTEKWLIGFLTGVPAYYRYKGLPLFFYYPLDEKPSAKFIKYTSKDKEEWDYSEITSPPVKWNYLPIVELAEPPFFF